MDSRAARPPRPGSEGEGRRPRVGRRARLACAVLAAAALAALGLLAWRSPVGAVPACPTWSVLGVHCPGCGSLRATHHLLNGRVRAALDHNAVLVVLGVPLAAYFGAELALIVASGRRLGARTGGAWIAWALLALFVIFTLTRNLPIGAALGPPPAPAADVDRSAGG